jgi:hypothetical protein
MSHHHIATYVALWSALFVPIFAATVALILAICGDGRPKAKAFDFGESARRIRARAIPARDRG